MSTKLDIVNRALQRIGAGRIGSLTDQSAGATEMNFTYDKVRRAEMRRNNWRFGIRRAVLRPVGTALAAWVSTTTYASGAFVSESGVNYISTSNSNTGNDPSLGVHWSIFYGNTTLKVTFSAWATGTAYTQGAVVLGSDSYLYEALGATTGADPTTDTTGIWTNYFGETVASCYDSTGTYQVAEIVFAASDATLVYSSTINGNTNDPATGIGWVAQACTAAPIVIPWPIGSGPQTQPTSKNVFVLPNGFLRRAPDDPTAGRTSFLGFPSNLGMDDYLLEGSYLTSLVSGPLVLRFMADIQDTSVMDDMFMEGLAARLAVELAKMLGRTETDFEALEAEYKQYMGDARNINGIEEGSTEPPLDDFIMCRF